MTPTAQELIAKLGLQPHHKGGRFREVYRSATTVRAPQGTRSAVTTIYYLLEQARISPWHVVQSDEIWHVYGGAPAELLSYDPATRTLQRYRLTVASGDGVQVAVIPAGSWQTTRCLGEYTLVGCTVAPGYEREDFRWVRDLANPSQHFSGHMMGLEAFL